MRGQKCKLNMSEKRRRWFQIHLSTAVVMLFATGALLWVNFIWERDVLPLGDESFVTHGWPIDGAQIIRGLYFVRVLNPKIPVQRFDQYQGLTFGLIRDWWLINFICGAAILAIIAWILEAGIRPPRGPQAMSEKKRRWFQIHLSTAIVVMFVCGGLLFPIFRSEQITDKNIYGGGWYEWDCGWPFAHSRFITFNDFQDIRFHSMHWSGAVIDGILMLGALIFVAIIFEWFIHGHEARKP